MVIKHEEIPNCKITIRWGFNNKSGDLKNSTERTPEYKNNKRHLRSRMEKKKKRPNLKISLRWSEVLFVKSLKHILPHVLSSGCVSTLGVWKSTRREYFFYLLTFFTQDFILPLSKYVLGEYLLKCIWTYNSTDRKKCNVSLSTVEDSSKYRSTRGRIKV